MAAESDTIGVMLHAIRGDTLKEVHDRALGSFGMVSCLRPLRDRHPHLFDVVSAPEGLRVTIRHSKGDQETKGATIAIPAERRLKPVAHLDARLARAVVTDGPLFRRLSQCGRRMLADRMSDRSVAET